MTQSDHDADAGHQHANHQLALSQLLRSATRDSHLALEDASGLPETLASLDGYLNMLLMFRALHGLTDGVGAEFSALFAKHGFFNQPGKACAALDSDLRVIGWRNETPLLESFLPTPLTSFAHSLGANYVMTGSALGNAIMRRYAEAHLGHRIAGASSFLVASVSSGGANFSGFRLALDKFGLTEPDAAIGVIDGARSTYLACTAYATSDHFSRRH